MAKDSKGHGSNSKGMGHAEHWDKAQALMKESRSLHASGDRRGGTDKMALAKEHADMAKHLLISEKRRAAGQTPAQKMGKPLPKRK